MFPLFILPISIPIWLILFVLLTIGGLVQGAFETLSVIITWVALLGMSALAGFIWVGLAATAAFGGDATLEPEKEIPGNILIPTLIGIAGCIASIYLCYRMVFADSWDAIISLVLFWVVFTVVIGVLMLICMGRSLVPSILRHLVMAVGAAAVLLWCVGYDVNIGGIAQYENIAYYDVFHVPEYGLRIIREGEEGLAADALYLYNTPEGAYNFNCPLDGQVIVGELHESGRAVPQLAEKPYRSGAVVWYPVVLADGSTGWLWSNPENDENSVNVVYALAGPQTEALVQAEVDQHWYRFLPRPLIDLSAQFFRAVPLWLGFSFHAA